MKVIQLTRGQVAIVDDEDFERIAQYRWFCQFVPKSKLMYAARSQYMGPDAKPMMIGIKMHHCILPKKEGFIIDHINGNGLDNRRENLRYGTHSQNRGNSGPSIKSTTGIRGVYYDPKRRLPWRAIIGHNGKLNHLGSFATAEEAHAAYTSAAKKQYGEFARIN